MRINTMTVSEGAEPRIQSYLLTEKAVFCGWLLTERGQMSDVYWAENGEVMIVEGSGVHDCIQFKPESVTEGDNGAILGAMLIVSDLVMREWEMMQFPILRRELKHAV